MVGVPGRSKGCLTCRKRRKGCDLQRPVCGQCGRLGIPCTGWDRDRVFVNGTGATAAVTRYVPPSGSAQALSCSAYEQQYLSIFWDLFLPGGYKFSVESKHMQYAHGNWTGIARGMYSRDSAVRNALLSVCLAAIGTADGRRDLIDESLRFYVSALAEMGEGLKSPRRGKSVALIIANRALATYEMIYGQQDEEKSMDLSQAKGWHSHNLGEEAILARGSPTTYIDGSAHALFVDGRTQQIISACMKRKRSFLSDDMWKTIPWSKHPKAPKQYLLDIAADLPALLEDVETIRLEPITLETRAETFTRVLKTCIRLDNDLWAWWANYAPAEELEELQARDYAEPSNDDLAVAHVVSFFYACCLLVYLNLHLCLSECRELHGCTPAVADMDLSSRTDPMKYCTLITDMIHVFLKPGIGIWWFQSAPFPAGIAMVFLMKTRRTKSPTGRKLMSQIGAHEELRNFLLSNRKEKYGPAMDESDVVF